MRPSDRSSHWRLICSVTAPGSEHSVRQELNAPARTYLLDIEPSDDDGIPIVRGYAGFWYDGDDAEIMTIGVGRSFQRRGSCGDAPAILDRIGQTAGRETHALGGARRQCAGDWD